MGWHPLVLVAIIILKNRTVIMPRIWDISFVMTFVMSNKRIKLFMVSLGTPLEGTVSQIFQLRLSFHLMTKNGKLFAFF